MMMPAICGEREVFAVHARACGCSRDRGTATVSNERSETVQADKGDVVYFRLLSNVYI